MILEQVLLEFPMVEIRYQIPGWVEMLPLDHPVKQEIIEKVRAPAGQRKAPPLAGHPAALHLRRLLRPSVHHVIP